VNSGSRWQTSGIHWRSGIIVTAEEVLEHDENIELTPTDRREARVSRAFGKTSSAAAWVSGSIFIQNCNVRFQILAA
jgi:hypothetical protein